jgi:hypothetical protein
MNNALSSLLCGCPPRNGDLAEVLRHFQSTIELLWKQILRVIDLEDDILAILGPMVGRSLLEQAFTALVARIDPWRILVSRQVQLQSSDEIRAVYRSSIRWQGDIMGPKPASEKALWSPETSLDKMSRSLLGDYCDHLLWRKAFAALLDETEPERGGAWMQDLRTLTPARFMARTRTEAGRLFSSLSKGVHSEFVIPQTRLADRDTVLDLLGDVLRIAAELALVSHAIPHLPFSLPREQALEYFETLQELEVF